VFAQNQRGWLDMNQPLVLFLSESILRKLFSALFLSSVIPKISFETFLIQQAEDWLLVIENI
jgi:hypothetical protein